MSAWLIWLIAAAVLGAAESISLDLVLVMCAAGAAAGSITAALGAPPAAQFAVAIAVGIVGVFLIRPVAKRHLLVGAEHTGVKLLIGKEAVVLDEVGPNCGLIRLNGGDWTARPYDGEQIIAAGQTVQVIKISGATALVWVAP